MAAHFGQERVAAGDDQGHQRKLRLGTLAFARIEQPGGLDVAVEVVHPDQRLALDIGQRLGEVHPDEQRAGQARSVGHRDGIDVGPGQPGILPGGVQDGHDPAQVGPGGNLGHDPAGRGMEGHLAGDDVGQDAPAILDECDARLVAARFDRQDQRTAHRPRTVSVPGTASLTGSGAASRAARRAASRATISGERRGSVVMIRASSLLSV